MEQFIPYGKQSISQEDINNVISVLKSDFLTQGPKVPIFEEKICEISNSDYSVACNSATSCLHLACLALGLHEGDYLWTTPITFVASANCAIYCNAKIDFVDIDLNTGLMSIEKLKQKLKIAKNLNILPKIVIPVHLAGSSCDMKSIYKLSKEYGFKIIEDASHAIGGFYNQFPVGSCKYSDISIFSFHPVKIITTGEGGVATTNSKDLAEIMMDLRSHGIVKEKERLINQSNESWYYEQQKLGFNYRLTDIAAALGLSQIERLEEFVYRRNKIFNNYKLMFHDLPINLLDIPPQVKSSIHLAIIKLDKPNEKLHNYLFSQLRKRGVGVQLHYFPVHLHPFYVNFGFNEGDFPNSEIYRYSAMSIPVFPDLNITQQKNIYNIIKKILNEFSNVG